MAVISGKDGYASFGGTDFNEVASWSLSLESNNPSYACKATSGYKKRVAGVKDATASIEGYISGKPTAPGSSGALVLYVDSSTTYTMDAICEGYSTEVNLEDGDIVSYTSEWALKLNSGAAPTEWS
jgi:hypothetical protein